MKKIFPKLALCLGFFCSTLSAYEQTKNLRLISPNQQLQLLIHVDPLNGVEYMLQKKGKVMVNWSPFGFVLGDKNLMT